jgi:hypothetical protein
MSERDRKPSCRVVCAAALLWTLTAGSALAQGTQGDLNADVGEMDDSVVYPDAATGPDGPRPTPFLLHARAEYQFDSGIDSAGDFNVIRAMGGAGFAFPIGDRFGMALGGGFGYKGYDFESAPVFGGSEPWENIYTTILSALAGFKIDDQWSVFGGGIFSLSAEEGADFGSSFTGGGVIGAGYRASPDFVVRLGVSVVSQIEDDVAVLPVVQLDWRITDRWRARAGSLDTGATDVIGAGLTYKLTEQWSIGGRIGYARDRFRLDDSGFAPEGVGQDDRFKATLSVTWRPTDTFELGLIGGMAFGGELRIEDEDGDRLFKEDYDPAAVVGARMAFRF